MTLGGRVRERLMADAISTCARGYAQAPDQHERAATQLQLLNAEWRRLLGDTTHFAAIRAQRGLPESFGSLEEFVASVPPTTRELVRERGREMASVSRPPDFWRMTGGSTSEPVQIPAWNSEVERTRPETWWGRSWYNITPASRIFLLWGHSHLLGSGLPGWLRARRRELSDRILGYHRFSTYDLRPEALQRAARMLLRFRPDCLIGYSVALDLFARANQAAGRELREVGLKVVVATAESFPSPESEERLRDLFACKVAMEYGSVETGVIAHTEPAGGYRTFWRSHLVEAEGVGESCRIRVTSLYPRCFPLVRYELNDEVAPTEPAPRHAVGLTTFSRVKGRCNDCITLSEGALIHSEAFSHALRSCPEIHGFQVVQNGGDLCIRFLSPADLPADRAREIRARLTKVHPELAATSLERVETLEQTPAGKTPMIVRR